MPVGGGDSHPACRVTTNAGDWFLKWNRRDALDMFQSERDGLELLANNAPGGLFVPVALAVDHDDTTSWLLLPWMNLGFQSRPEMFGKNLVALHRVCRPEYGLHINNYLGRSPQQNTIDKNWAQFWWQRRLLPHFERACQNGFGAALEPRMQQMEMRTMQLLDHQPEGSLLHGDLWSGNQDWLRDGRPALFDPAPYFGDRETDLAMMRLFGGFEDTVFETYLAHWPLPPGAAQREPLYQLYHLLNHLNLFGSGWLSRVQHVMDIVMMDGRSAPGVHNDGNGTDYA